MRWLGIIALSLLALVPLCSSDGNQSNTTALPFANQLAKDEIHDSSSLFNSTGISTILPDAEASPTASAIDPSIGNLSTVIPVMQEETTSEQGSEIKFSSTHNTLEPTPSWEDDEDVENDEAASSEADDVEAEPSRSSGVESQPQSVESPPAQSANSSELDKYSAADLEIKLNEKKIALEEAKNVTESTKKARDSKQEELNRANDDYEEKKKKWEDLTTIAKQKAESWEKDEHEAEKANSDYATAKESFETANNKLTEESEKLKNFPALVKEAEDKLEAIKKRPERLIELQQSETDKINGKPQLQPNIDRLYSIERAKNRELITAQTAANADIAKYARDNCNDPSKALPTCSYTASSIEETGPKAKQAETDHKNAKEALEAAKKELRDYDTDLWTIQNEIAKLKAAEPNNKQDFDNAASALKTLNDGRGFLEADVKYWDEVKKKAEDDQELKRLSNETAHEKVKNGRPPEIDAARNEADHALSEMNTAKQKKSKIDRKLKKLENELNSAKATETALDSEVGRLETAYAEARKKENEEPKKGSSVPVIVGASICGVVLLIGVGIAVFIIYYKKFYKKKKRTPGARVTNTAGPGETDQLLPPPQGTSATTRSSSKANLSDQGSAQQNGQQPSNVLMACLNSCNEEKKNPADIKPGETPAPNVTDQPGGLPDLSVTPFIPGEKPFKIPAKNFKWKGPLIRRSRWHGEPKHLLEGKKGPEKLDKIWFDPNANYATEIGATEIMEDGGPPSDSNRSEWLNSLDDWEKGRKEMLAAEAAAKNGGKSDAPKTDDAKGKEEHTNVQPQTNVTIATGKKTSGSKKSQSNAESTARSDSFSKDKVKKQQLIPKSP